MFANAVRNHLANAVGYQAGSFENQGYNIGAASFRKIATAEADMTIGDLVPNAAFIANESKVTFIAGNGANAKIYSEALSKTVTKTLVYLLEKDCEDGEGWYLVDDADDEGGIQNMNGLKIAFGEGFLVRIGGTPAGQNLTYSGEVKAKDPTTADIPNQGYNICGNCSPVPLKIGDITPNSAFIENESKITFVTGNGANAKMYSEGLDKTVTKTLVYLLDKDCEDGEGWYLVDDADDEGGLYNMNEKITIEAAEGFFVRRGGSDSTQRVSVPAAIE